jgi:hypothetical protein
MLSCASRNLSIIATGFSLGPAAGKENKATDEEYREAD